MTTTDGSRVPSASPALTPLPWRQRARAARALRRTRGDRPALTDRAFAVYAGGLAVVIVGAPLVRAAVLALSDPGVVPALVSAEAVGGVGLLFGLLLAGLILLGGMRGPALRSPFASATLASTDVPRRLTLRAPWWTWTAVVSGALALVMAIAAGGPWAAGAATASDWAVCVLAAALYGIVASGCWLLGQRLPPRVTAAVGSAAVVLAVLGAVLPAVGSVLPWGWAAAGWPGAASAAGPVEAALEGAAVGGSAVGGSVVGGSAVGGSVVGLVALGVGAVAVVVLAPRLLDGLRGSDLVEQASRQDVARTLAVTGDVAAASARYRALPSFARRARAIVSDRILLAYLWRDLVGAVRTPFRLLGGLVVCATAVGILAVAASLDPAVAWAAAGPAGVLAFLGMGSVTDGFRGVASGIAAPALLRQRTAAALLLHAALPVLFSVLAVVLGVAGAPALSAVGGLGFGGLGFGGLGTLALGGSGAVGLSGSGALALGGSGAAGALLVPVALGTGVLLAAVALRMVDALRGPLPLAVLAPIPTPVGDLSILVQLAWQADALIAAFVLAASATALAAVSPFGLLVIPVGMAVAALRAVARARALRP